MNRKLIEIEEIERELKMTNEELRKKSIKKNLENEYFTELESEHRKLFLKLSDREFSEIFPEAKEDYILPKIAELEETARGLEKFIRDSLEKIKNSPDSWFWEDVIIFFPGKDLSDAKKQMSKLKNMLSIYKEQTKVKTVRGGVTKDEIAQAKLKPLEIIVGQNIKLGRSGNNFMGICPFHDDHTPSFCVFSNTNRYRCFGCNKHGDSIEFVINFYHVDFLEAVRYLNNNYY